MRLAKDRGGPGERVVWMAPGDADRPLFVFVEAASSGAGGADPLLRHLGFELDSAAAVDRLHGRLVDAGLDSTDPVHVDDVVGYVTMVRDPDGRVVEFTHGQDVSPANWD